MSTISNKFFVTALEDGTTLHGSLRSDKSLVQSNNNGACLPDWTVAENQPTIYVSLYKGTTLIAPDAGGTWLYNNTTITFSTTTNLSTNEAFAGIFLKTTKSVDIGGSSVSMPALKIVGNLADLNQTVDMDMITYQGAATMSVAPIPFSASIEIRITTWVSGGYLGVLSFVDGIADITQKGQSVTINGTLVNDGGAVSHTKDWYLNENIITSTSSTDDVYIDDGSLVVKEQGVVDYATVRCDFKVDNNVVYTAYVGIDDTQDPEYMYVQVANGSGNSASLRSGESVTFKVWVGTMDDPTPNTLWNRFKVKLLDAEGTMITAATYTGESIDGNGYRTMTLTDSGGQFYASYTLTYDFVADMSKGKKSITGIILAEQITDVEVDDEA